ncbi:CheY-like receiver [Euzebya pacifica]|uniref:CheY-like receiver n=1 Tax=Euzebya pacifica TaxID=1608957 RepID=A0A346XT57_9ACTN|nr:hypothetical protein [Euzebya pacifica]AXV05404.1 CheY-like receiver [Euzebya pacifica]
MADVPLPDREALRDLFSDLLSKTCAVERIDDGVALSPGTVAVIAEYVDADGEAAGAAIADLPFACRSGSALVMMPPTVADEALEAAEIDGDMFDCFKEVVNVLSRVLNSPDSPHVKLRGMYRVGELLPGGVRTLLQDGDRRRHFTVDIEEYGTGVLTVVSRAEIDVAAAA